MKSSGPFDQGLTPLKAAISSPRGERERQRGERETRGYEPLGRRRPSSFVNSPSWLSNETGSAPSLLMKSRRSRSQSSFLTPTVPKRSRIQARRRLGLSFCSSSPEDALPGFQTRREARASEMRHPREDSSQSPFVVRCLLPFS